MAKKRNTGLGPRIDEGVEYKVITATKKSLEGVLEKLRKFPGYALCELVSVSPQQFTGAEAGRRFLEENSEKWDGRFCPYVSIRNTEELKTPKVVELRKKIAAEEKALLGIKNKTDAASFKSKLAGCPKCDSKVNRKYIKDSSCPVCGADLRAPSAAASIKRKEESIKKLKLKLSVECSKHAGEAPLRYLVALPAICK